jgi:hypothetical protein
MGNMEWVWKRNVVQHSRKSMIASILALVLLLSALSGAGLHLYITAYHDDLPLAKEGMQHLQTAEAFFTMLARNPLSAQVIAQAQQQLKEALKDFTQIDNDLRIALSIGTVLPLPGGQLHAALHLIPLAIAISQAGVTGCSVLDLLIARLHDPLRQQAKGITTKDLTFMASAIHDIHSSLSVALNEADQLQPGDLQFAPGASKAVDTMRKDGPQLMSWFDSIERLLPVAALLLGADKPANYLIEVLDSTELRPGGGFIGNYGIATLVGGKLAAAHITDTYLLDRAFEAAGRGILPPQYSWFDIAGINLGLRDSNLEADFPTAARAAESIYAREGGKAPLQGVIAFTPMFIEQILDVTGPITVPEYHEMVNAQDLVALIHHYQMNLSGAQHGDEPSPDGHSSLRKRFTELLAEHLLARVRQLAPSKVAQILPLMMRMLRTKDLQIYCNEPAAEALLSKAQLDAAIQRPPGDDVLVVDTNIAISKANGFLKNTLNDRMVVDEEGNVVHHMTLHYDWMAQGCQSYRDYVRVYAPTDGVLLQQHGWQPRGTGQAFGHEVWAGFFAINCGQTESISLTWSVPHVATHTANGWHYQEMLQKQAGSFWTLHVQVILPSCASQVRATGGVVPMNGKVVRLDQMLSENTVMSIDYAC